MMAEVGELFIGVVVMVSEDDIVQLVLLGLLFQPMDILGEVFTFKSYSDVYPVVVFLTIPVIATVRLAEISAIVYLPLASGVRAFPFTVTTGTDWS